MLNDRATWENYRGMGMADSVDEISLLRERRELMQALDVYG